ncbi:MAG: saccharopine dehydrogenase NADP-binding domain-containing protein [Calditrichaceae bacterium]|nr:saccharopine dehydrogenase NADP-binding domain-containing protein [Calditrichaceae bacterium]
MKRLLVLGAGKSSPYLITYLLERAKEYDWFVTVADYDLELAKSRVGSHPRGEAIQFDVNNSDQRSAQIKKADVVLNILAPRFQHVVALTCVRFGRHMISVSYEDLRIRDIEEDANRKGVLILTEIGLDPGIDHMAAAELIERIKQKGGIIKSFESYGGGLPAPDSISNPFKYVISWNPRNVVMAGENGAQYLEKGQIKIIPWHNVFRRTWNLEIEGLGLMEAYPNRDSLNYRERYGFSEAETVVRGTIRYPGWSETWFHIMRLGWPNETLRIPDLENRTYAEVTEMFLPLNVSGNSLEKRVAGYLDISPTGSIMEKMRWLGLFSDEKTGKPLNTSAEVLTDLISEKLKLMPDMRDMVILLHRLLVRYPEENNREEEITSTMVNYGEKAGFSSMAKSVGLPAALVAKLLLTRNLPLTGCHIPTHPDIYKPVLKELAEAGIAFKEKVKTIKD